MAARPLRKVLAAVFVLAAAAITVLVLRPSRPRFDRLRVGRDFSVILVTVDTLRADRIGCYGHPTVKTPTIDAFAASGVRFERCVAQTPLTLPSHTTILTGTLPVFHGIRDNGGFIASPELVTLAEVFKDRGYETGAFVAAYVLDSKWGLGQGFDTYYDKFDLSRFERISLGEVQRPAGEVIDQALAWLEGRTDRKFFAWVHLYDPHTPYTPPEPFKSEYPQNPYLGEIAYADSELGRLWDFVVRSGLRDRVLLVFAADHGESLGEHGESTHGFFVYQGAVHVPLIFVTPFRRLQGLVRSEVVTLADIMPTVCEMVGLPAPPQVQGRSLVPALFREGASGERLAYAETYYPRYHFGWSELRSVQSDRFKLILAPVPELYDLARDPGEEKNLVYLERDVFRDLSARAEALMDEAGRNALEADFKKIDEETRERLAALGYVGSFMDSSRLQGQRLADPKDKIGVFNKLAQAREAGLGGSPEEGIRTIQSIIAEDPGISDAHFSLGNIFYKARRFAEALEAFKRSLELKPDDSFAVINIANSLQALRRPEEAERFILDHLAKGFEDPQLFYHLGHIRVRRGDPAGAIGYFEKCLASNPRSAAAHNALAAVYLNRDGPGDLAKAEEHLNAAAALSPTLMNLRYNLAQLREKQDHLDEAAELYRREIEDAPGHFKALFNLARVYRLMGREDDELAALERTITVEPDFPVAYFYLARILLRRGRDLEKAVALTEKGLALKPPPAELPLGYFLLADLYNRLGDPVRSEDYAAKGRAAAARAKR